MSEDLRYPIGPFQAPGTVSESDRQLFIQQIADTPAQLRESVRGLTDEQLSTPYRDGGWTPRQVAHHIADSHLNSYVRFKLAVTENTPTIKAYNEAVWAELDDAKNTPAETSVQLLESLHERWVRFLRTLSGEELERTFLHPELGTVTVDRNIALYAWHGRHHVAHITALRQRNGWD